MLKELTTVSRIQEANTTLDSILEISSHLEIVYLRNRERDKVKGLYDKLSDTFKRTIDKFNDASTNERLKRTIQHYAKKSDLISDISRIHKEANERLDLGKKYLNEGNHSKAIEHFDQAMRLAEEIEDRGETIEISYAKAFALLNEGSEGSLKQALLIYKNLIELDPNGRALFYVGYIYGKLTKHNESLQYYQEYLKRYPGDAATLTNLGWTYTKLGDYEKALKYYYTAFDVDPRNSVIANNIGDVLENLGIFDEAIRWYDVAIDIDPNKIRALSNKIILLDQLNRTEAKSEAERAIRVCDRIIDEQPTNISVLVDKAIALDIAGKKEEAIDWYDKALKMDPQNTYALYNKSCTMSLLGWDINIILDELKKAITIDPVYKNLAKDDKDFDRIKDDERFRELIK